MDRRPGCLSGLAKLFLLDAGYNWAQRRFGFGSRSGCGGCGCGLILLVVFIFLLFSILFGTDWGHLRFLVPQFVAMI
jgi:hypothetical protein